MTLSPSFLVLRGGAIGDFVVTVPALQAIRQRWPRARIELAGYPHILRLAMACGLADRSSSLERADFARLFAAGTSFDDAFKTYVQSFDVVVSYLYDPDGIARANLKRLGAEQVIYGDPVVRAQHAIDHLLEPLVELAIFATGAERPVLRPASRHAVPLPVPHERAVVVHAGSGSAEKNWPLARYIDLAEALRSEGWAPCFPVGEADTDLEAPLRESFGDAVLPAQDLPALAATLSQARAFIGNDSGITHIAAGLGVPTLALFGPSDPALWAPRGEQVCVLAAPERNRDSLRELSVTDVLQAFGDLAVSVEAQ